MPYDVKAEMFSRTSVVGAAGAVTETLTSIGFVYLERVRVTTTEVMTGGREAPQHERVFRARFHSLLTLSTRLRIDGVDYFIARMDEVARRKGWVLYLDRTEAL